MNTRPILVIGAGISGLSTALTLKKRGADVLVLDANPHPGGVARAI